MSDYPVRALLVQPGTSRTLRVEPPALDIYGKRFDHADENVLMRV
jgi:hypothetical protein